MKLKILIAALVVIVLYVGLVATIGFEGLLALSIHFGRLAISMGVLILYIPSIKYIFVEVPAPRRDYLIAGILLTWLSGVGFSIWNVAGRVLHADTSIFTSPVAGFFSLLLLSGGVFHLIAPQVTQAITRREALLLGALFAALLVIVAPMLG